LGVQGKSKLDCVKSSLLTFFNFVVEFCVHRSHSRHGYVEGAINRSTER
jgi:hypothetical protein